MKSKTMKLGMFALLSLAIGANSFAQKGKGGEKEILYLDFEKVKNKEKIAELGGIDLIEGLSSPTEIKADVFQKDSKGDVNIPENVYGKEEPSPDGGGNTYAGIVVYKPGKAQAERSYITIPLMKGKDQMTLRKGLTYCVEYSISLAESSKFATNNLGALFSKEVLGTGATGAIYNNSDRLIRGQQNKIYTGFFGWEKVCNIYTAKGDEKFVTIGNFDRNETTKFEQVKKPKDSETEVVQHAYYYIDNVIVRQVDNPSECKCFNNAKPKVEDSFSSLLYSCTPEVTDKMTQAQIINSHVVYFRAGKSAFSQNAKEMMNFVIEEMKKDPKMMIEVVGHNEAIEDKAGEENPDYEDMARKRAQAVAKYLVDNGIEESRITKTYKGATTPNPDITEDDEQEVKDAKNRRVNFILK